MTEKSASTVLHKLLDERGVEYETYKDINNRCITKWRTYHGAFVFFAVEKEGKLFVETASDTEHSAICTPEQAIAATLGSELNPDGLPVGLTISEDGELLNWRGENYAKQSTLRAERDEWKERYDSVLEGRNRWSGIVDGIYRRFYPREKYCLPIDPTDMINEAIDAIERERDEWKAKAIVATRGDDVTAFERK